MTLSMTVQEDGLLSTIHVPVTLSGHSSAEHSKVRSHNGNIPTLPQTKCCHLCPAKFTRTTHLNRHLRSHTNERLHRCDICLAEFTRSDLLTRHKRTCGDASNQNKSRRKSCQACAESKIKCDIQQPCSKCVSRGRECVFLNDPVVTRAKLRAPKKVRKRSDSGSSRTSTSQSVSSPSDSALTTPISYPTSPKDTSNPCSKSPSPVSSHPSEDLHFDLTALDLSLHTSVMDERINPLVQHGIFDLMEHTLFDGMGFPSTSGVWLDPNDQTFEPLPESVLEQLNAQNFSMNLPTPQGPTVNGSQEYNEGYFDVPAPNEDDLQEYLCLFFSAFSTHVPVIHPWHWYPEYQPPVLIQVMRACGALFAKNKTPTVVNFIDKTMESTRDTLTKEFAKSVGKDECVSTALLFAVLLLQTIQIFHHRADMREAANVYHGMLVMMIRRTGLLSKACSWVPPNINDPSEIEDAWREWAKFESVKRGLYLAYIHDCTHCMFFSLPPAFKPEEFDIGLPCDDALWRANSALEWYNLLQQPSIYGTGHVRLAGTNMQIAMSNITDLHVQGTQLSLNPCAHFVLIHTILRNLYTSHLHPMSVPPKSSNTFAAQFSLHNWLQCWLNSQESMQLEKDDVDPPFFYNVLPFYWLAQVTLLAIQDGTPISGAKFFMDGKDAGRMSMMRDWMERIRAFLRTGDKIPVQLWDDLMQVKPSAFYDSAASSPDSENSDILLTSFIPRN